MNRIILIALIIVVLIAGGFFLLSSNKPSPSAPSSKSQEEKSNLSFENPKKSAHYESNTPEHGSTLAEVPINTVINFNFDLAVPSSIKIEKDGKDFGVGDTVIDQNKLSMRRGMDSNSPDGLYKVSYNACWPDGSCHDGYFQFAIDRVLSSSFEDMTGKNEVTIRMSEIKFMPMNLKISEGTKIIWINDDSEIHYVNTDSHPAHTYYPEQNSKALEKGESFSLVFDKAGIYPYHCSAHESAMKASIIVE